VFEMLGVQDVVAKSIGSQNPYNMIRAGLKQKSRHSRRAVSNKAGEKPGNGQ
jgi:small subunit ribosomal protein S5